MSSWSQSITEALGLTLLDSLWQGAIIILLCTLSLALMRSKAARWRYRLVLAGILALPLAGVVTFLGHYEAASPEVVHTIWAEEVFMPAPQIDDIQTTAQTNASGIIERWQSWSLANAQWVVMIWIVGLALFALRLAGGFYMVQSLRNSASFIEDEYWLARLQELKKNLHIELPVQIKESVKVSSPIVIGYLKPIIIFPLGLLQGITTDQVEAILLHELAHIKRHDYLINLLVSLLQAVYFYHPAFWWLQKQLDAEREYSCDDLVLRQMSQLSLIKALTAVKDFQMAQYSPALGFASHKNQLLKRVERIMKRKTKTNWLGGLISMSVLLLSFFLMSYRSVSSTEEILPADAFMDEGPELILQLDSLTIEQAVIQLLNQDEHHLVLGLDGNGRLVDLVRNNKPVQKAELRVFQQAHAKLRDYRYAQVKQSESFESYSKKLQELEQLYKSKSDALNSRQKAVEDKQQAEELKRAAEAYQREYEELRRRAREGTVQKLKSSNNLDSLLIYNPTLIREYKEGMYGKWTLEDSISITVHRNSYTSSPVIAKFKIAISQMQKRLEELEAKGLSLVARQPLSQGKYEFKKEAESQKTAIGHLWRQSQSKKHILIELDGKIKEDWTAVDVERIDYKRAIVSIEVIPAEEVKEAKYQKWMETRKGLVKVKTEEVKEGFIRPKTTELPSLKEYFEIQEMKSELELQNEQLKAQAELMRLRKAIVEQMRNAELQNDSVNALYQKMVPLLKRKEALYRSMDSLRVQDPGSQDVEREVEALKKRLELIKMEMDKLIAQGYIRPVSMEFTGSEMAQTKALDVMSRTSKSLDKPLVVIDGQVYEDWGVHDINQYDRSRKIASLDFIRASKVTDEKYKRYMEGRDYLFLVTTQPGKKKYRRPDMEIGVLVSPEEMEARKKENLTKTMLDKLNADGLTPKGWNSLLLSQNSLIIGGVKQPKKVHKEYLRLYQKLMNKKLGKGVTVELKE